MTIWPPMPRTDRSEARFSIGVSVLNFLRKIKLTIQYAVASVNDFLVTMCYTNIMADEKDIQTNPAEQQAPDYGEILAAWDFYEHEQHERGTWWYIISAV